MTFTENDVKPGTKVTFEHGAGRKDDPPVMAGVVNGNVSGWYVPVHVHEGNRNVLVHLLNIKTAEPF